MFCFSLKYTFYVLFILQLLYLIFTLSTLIIISHDFGKKYIGITFIYGIISAFVSISISIGVFALKFQIFIPIYFEFNKYLWVLWNLE